LTPQGWNAFLSGMKQLLPVTFETVPQNQKKWFKWNEIFRKMP